MTFDSSLWNITKANTVNKVNKFVMVFALPLHLDNFVMAIVP
jgi:hypothetical protein